MIDHPSYHTSTTIRCALSGEGWRVTRKIGEEKFRLYGYYETLGDAAAMIRNAERACSSDWKVEGVAIDGRSTALDIAARLQLEENT